MGYFGWDRPFLSQLRIRIFMWLKEVLAEVSVRTAVSSSCHQNNLLTVNENCLYSIFENNQFTSKFWKQLYITLIWGNKIIYWVSSAIPDCLAVEKPQKYESPIDHNVDILSLAHYCSGTFPCTFSTEGMSLCRCGELSLDQPFILFLLSNGEVFLMRFIMMIKEEGSFPWVSTALPAQLCNDIKLRADAVVGQRSARPHQFSAPSPFIVKCFPIGSIFEKLHSLFHSFYKKILLCLWCRQGEIEFVVVTCLPPHHPPY